MFHDNINKAIPYLEHRAGHCKWYLFCIQTHPRRSLWGIDHIGAHRQGQLGTSRRGSKDWAGKGRRLYGGAHHHRVNSNSLKGMKPIPAKQLITWRSKSQRNIYYYVNNTNL